ncbi:DUF4149 domain-containing protein [Hyphomicrobiales bacterium]|jgi:hypothetical protein|nr:DUF4149 domain-containing protein [Hyphomicrobiales bacterium]|tara:strand:+ start:264 stop:662 length:399 start_codon:yes stop_codon:yes gene_type:complete
MVVNFLVSGLLAIMIFYSFGIAINVHRTLDKENAGKLLRKLFPIYFLWGIVISITAEIIYLLEGLNTQAFIMAIIVIGYLYSRQTLVPKLNKNRDLANEGDEKSKKIFNSLHFQSVAINLIQMLLLAFILFI